MHLPAPLSLERVAATPVLLGKVLGLVPLYSICCFKMQFLFKCSSFSCSKISGSVMDLGHRTHSVERLPEESGPCSVYVTK